MIGLGLLIAIQLALIIVRASRPLNPASVAIANVSTTESPDSLASWPLYENASKPTVRDIQPSPPPVPELGEERSWQASSAEEPKESASSVADSDQELVIVVPADLDTSQELAAKSAPVEKMRPEPTPADPATEAFAELDFSLDDEMSDIGDTIGNPADAIGSANQGDVPLLPFTRDIVSRAPRPVTPSTPADATKWNGSQRWDPLPREDRAYRPDTPWIEPQARNGRGNSPMANQMPTMSDDAGKAIHPHANRQAPVGPYPPRASRPLTPPRSSYPTAPTWPN